MCSDNYPKSESRETNSCVSQIDTEVQQIFTEIYSGNQWGDPDSRSGPGSSVFRTRLIRPALAQLFKKLGLRSVLDVPCGDFNWMRLVEMSGILYTGADVVPEIVERNTELHSNECRRFVHLNMIADPLPSADLILCRDGLVHLSFSDIASTLRRMRSSGATYLLLTTFDAHLSNLDIATGEWRPLNVLRPPLAFPPPISKIWDGPRPDSTYSDKMLVLYEVADLPTA
jgi:hypothetical protein